MMFEHGDRVLCHLPDGRAERGVINAGDEPPHESVHGTLYEVVLLGGPIVADETMLEPLSAVDQLAELARG